MKDQENGKEKKPVSPAVKRKRKQRVKGGVRFGTQVLFFIFFPSAYAAAFNGVKYIFNQIGDHQLVSMTPFVEILIGLCLYTIVFGRFFCGYACAFGSLGDWIFGIHKAIRGMGTKRPVQIPEGIMSWLSMFKYVVLGGIIILCVMRLYDRTRGMSPWDVFSQVRSWKLDALLTDYRIGCVIMGALVICMFFSERFFCRVICPMGAVFSLLPVLPWLTVRRDRPNCIQGCRGCIRACPVGVEPADLGAPDTNGECIQCRRCMGVCPRENITSRSRKLPGSQVLYLLLEIGLLAFLLWKLNA